METTIVLSVFKEIRDWIFGIEKSRTENLKENKIAIKAIYIALAETKFYFADIKTKKRDIEKERQISKLWFEASVELKTIDTDLAERCFRKGDYWADQENWNQKDKETLNISLEEMTKLSRKLLTT